MLVAEEGKGRLSAKADLAASATCPQTALTHEKSDAAGR